jgi:hypothetical protein
VFFHPGDTALHTASRIVPGFAVYRFEFTAVDRNNRLRKQLKAATQLNELTAYPTYALASIRQTNGVWWAIFLQNSNR